MIDSLSVDVVALLPTRGPWAAHFLAGVLAFEREPVELERPEATEPLARLGLACAMRGFGWSMAMNGEAFEFALQLGHGRGGCFDLITQAAKYAARFVVEAEVPSRVRLTWDDDAVRELGDLETFSRALLSEWFASLMPDYEGDCFELPVPGEVEAETLRRFVRAVTERRAALVEELAPELAALEQRLSGLDDDDGAFEAMYARWSALGDRLAVARSTPPWPTYVLRCDEP